MDEVEIMLASMARAAPGRRSPVVVVAAKAPSTNAAAATATMRPRPRPVVVRADGSRDSPSSASMTVFEGFMAIVTEPVTEVDRLMCFQGVCGWHFREPFLGRGYTARWRGYRAVGKLILAPAVSAVSRSAIMLSPELRLVISREQMPASPVEVRWYIITP